MPRTQPKTSVRRWMVACAAATAVGAGVAAVGFAAAKAGPAAGAFPPIARKLPPLGVALTDADHQKLESELMGVTKRIAAFEKSARLADVEADLLADVKIYEKAVRLALFHDEFYKGRAAPPAKPKAGAATAKSPPADAPPRGVATAHDLLKSANARLDVLEKGSAPWAKAKGQIVRGYTSAIDGSAQPYGLEIPDDLDLSKPVPLYIWLHGRGDDATDLYFVKSRDGGKRGELQPKGAIVLHPFGRQCVGWKSAGEVDVLEAIESVKKRYKIDENRVALAGFSMGGAGAWLLGAHYADHWVLVQPGAGYVDVKNYQNVDPDTAPMAERTLWGVNDVPDYVHNLFNVPVISYSGENDKQRASAELMAKVYEAEGQKLTRFIGPKVEHKWLPLPDMLKLLNETVAKGRDPNPAHVRLQTRTLRYNKMFWVTVTGLGEHWVDARVDAKFVAPHAFELTTSNVTELSLSHPAFKPRAGGPEFPPPPGTDKGGQLPTVALVTIDGETVKVFPANVDAAGTVSLAKGPHGWLAEKPGERMPGLRKSPGLQGPIDDAFVAPFLFVAPTGQAASPAVQKWADVEMRHQQDRWQALMRGDVRIKKDVDVTADDIEKYNLVCWGDAKSNKVIARTAEKLPAAWTNGKLAFGGKTYDPATHVPALIYPNPLNPTKYVVLNSGLTFREAHDGTNSQQNPKLGDWAILDVTTPPTAAAPAKVVANGFFDETWKLKQVAK